MEILSTSNAREYSEFVENCPKGHFMQAPAWAGVKANWQWNAIVERNSEGTIIGGISALTRRLPVLPFKLIYIPRGPVCNIHELGLVKKLIDDAVAFARTTHAFVIKIDPDVPIAEKEFYQVFEKSGFVKRAESEYNRNAQRDILFRLNISGKTEEEVFAGFHSKTKYNIRLALRHGVEVKIKGKEALDEFVSIMLETGSRDGFPTRGRAYFERLLDCLGDHARLYMVYCNNEPLSGALAVNYGDKMWYLYGASSNSHRNFMPNYLLQWEMIKYAISSNCKIYDFRGVPTDSSSGQPLQGLYRFKSGFCPDLTELGGEYEFVLNRPVLFLVNCAISFKSLLSHLKCRFTSKKDSHKSEPHKDKSSEPQS